MLARKVKPRIEQWYVHPWFLVITGREKRRWENTKRWRWLINIVIIRWKTASEWFARDKSRWNFVDESCAEVWGIKLKALLRIVEVSDSGVATACIYRHGSQPNQTLAGYNLYSDYVLISIRPPNINYVQGKSEPLDTVTSNAASPWPTFPIT